jgi:hypothetical protein
LRSSIQTCQAQNQVMRILKLMDGDFLFNH